MRSVVLGFARRLVATCDTPGFPRPFSGLLIISQSDPGTMSRNTLLLMRSGALISPWYGYPMVQGDALNCTGIAAGESGSTGEM